METNFYISLSQNKGKTKADHGFARFHETSFIDIETGTSHSQKPQRIHVNQKEPFISITLSSHQEKITFKSEVLFIIQNQMQYRSHLTQCCF